MNIVLYEPQIPPNTGNIARLCAALRFPLHLVGKLGFEISDRSLKRAGLDYWEFLTWKCHESLSALIQDVPAARMHFFSKRAGKVYIEARFQPGDYLVFGNETGGLPDWVFRRYPDRFLRIPIFHSGVRSLNLSSSVAVAAYEALRQTGRLV